MDRSATQQGPSDDDAVQVFVAETRDGHRVEFTESTACRPGGGLACVVGVSTLFGCPIRCRICDAGGHYEGRLTRDELLGQVRAGLERWPRHRSDLRELRVRFDRMGEPSFNPAVLDAMVLLKSLVAPTPVVPFISTVAPARTEAFFEMLAHLKDDVYPRGDFAVQLSLHSSDPATRGWLIPVKLRSFEELARWGEGFVSPGDRKVLLSFAVAENIPLDPLQLLRWFSPQSFAVNLTPVNPTAAAEQAGVKSAIAPGALGPAFATVERFRRAGYEVQLSLTGARQHGSSAACGQCATRETRGELKVRRTRTTRRDTVGA